MVRPVWEQQQWRKRTTDCVSPAKLFPASERLSLRRTHGFCVYTSLINLPSGQDKVAYVSVLSAVLDELNDFVMLKFESFCHFALLKKNIYLLCLLDFSYEKSSKSQAQEKGNVNPIYCKDLCWLREKKTHSIYMYMVLELICTLQYTFRGRKESNRDNHIQSFDTSNLQRRDSNEGSSVNIQV